MQAEREELARQRHDLEARELEVERITRALNLNAVVDAKAKYAAPVAKNTRTLTQEQAPFKPKRASSQVASQRSLAPTQGRPSGIKVTSTITTKTVKPLPASPQVGTDQDMNAMVQDMIRSSLTQFGVIPKKTPTQLRAQSFTMEPVSPQKVDLSEGEILILNRRVPIQGLLNWTN